MCPLCFASNACRLCVLWLPQHNTTSSNGVTACLLWDVAWTDAEHQAGVCGCFELVCHEGIVSQADVIAFTLLVSVLLSRLCFSAAVHSVQLIVRLLVICGVLASVRVV
jgi:hypothetical protein